MAKPFINGTIVDFTVSFTLPNPIDAAWGNMVITDALPTGFAYKAGDGNKVSIDGTPLTTGYTFSEANGVVTASIDSNADYAGKAVVVTIETVVSDITKITDISSIKNTATLKFVNVQNNSGEDDVTFALEAVTAIITDDHGNRFVVNKAAQPIELKAHFTAPSYAQEYDPQYQFVITNDISGDLNFEGVAVKYGASETPVSNVNTTNVGSKYTFTFDNSDAIKGQNISIEISTNLKENVASATIPNQFTLAIAGNEETQSTAATITLVAPITVTKEVLDN